MFRLRAGAITLAALLSASALYSAIGARLGCPLGEDPSNPFESICAQTVAGLWRSVGLAVGVALASCAVAVSLALIARRLRGVADVSVEKFADFFFSVPDVLVLITLGFVARAVSGQDDVSLGLMSLGLVAIGWAAPTRMVLNRLRTLERQDFITAAFSLGASRTRVLLRHLLPFAWDFLLAIFLLRVPAIVLTESTVSYLGFGLPLSQPSLGKFVGEHWRLLMGEQWFKIVPAWVLLVLVVISFQWLGNGLLRRATQGRA